MIAKISAWIMFSAIMTIGTCLAMDSFSHIVFFISAGFWSLFFSFTLLKES